MKKWAKRFFWSTCFSAVMMGVFASNAGNREMLKFAFKMMRDVKNKQPLTPEMQEKTLKMAQELETKTGLNLKKIANNGSVNYEEFLWQVEEKLPVRLRNKLRHLRNAKPREAEALEVVTTDGSGITQKTITKVIATGERAPASETEDDKSSTRTDDGRRYVQIDGQYYLYREDHTYLLPNGEKVYFVDNVNSRVTQSEDAATKTASNAPGFYNTEALSGGAHAPPALQQQLKALQEGLDKRNQALEELVGPESK